MNKKLYSNIRCSIVVLICIKMASTGADEISKTSKSGVGLTSVAANILDESESVLVEPLTRFSGDLFRAVKSDKQNVILSPLSIHSALNLLLLGADSSSGTEAELFNALGYSNNPNVAQKAHESYAKLLSIFRQITEIGLSHKQDDQSWSSDDKPPVLDFWTMGIVKKGFNLAPSYLEQVKKYYNSSIKQTGTSEENRKLVSEINAWAKEAGFDNGVVDQNELDSDLSILLLSAVRVQAFWFEEFVEYEVAELFYNHGLRNQLVKNSVGMSCGDFNGAFFEFTHDPKSKYNKLNDRVKSVDPAIYQELANFEFRIIEVPLIGNLTFTIFEPLKNGTGLELAKLEEQLLTIDPKSKQTRLSHAFKFIDNLAAKSEIEYLRMPKFKFESDIPLKPSLMSLGIKRVFGAQTAELTKLSSKQERQYVSEAKHQAVIEVNKSGIKAAGITIIKGVGMSLIIRQNPIRLLVENPFMFVLRYSKVPLFIGQLVHL